MDWNIEFLFCYLAAWHEVERKKCKRGPQVSYTHKIKGTFNKMNLKTFVVSVVANPKLLKFVEPTRILCARHLQAICFLPPNY